MKTTRFAKRAAQGFVGAVALAASCAALAGVTEWGFEVNSGFTAYAPNAAITASDFNTALSASSGVNVPSLLTWGNSTGFGQSSLGVGVNSTFGDGRFVGSVLTGAPAVDTVQVIHNNNPITGTTLTSATLTDLITLTPLDPPGASFSPLPLLFSINFLETTNSTPCLAPSPSGNPCNDIFIIDVAGAGFNPADNTLNQTFFYDAGDGEGLQDYNAILAIDGLTSLGSTICNQILGFNVRPNCIGFTTVEGLENTFQVSLQITDTPFVVPEPASLALVGLGLAGLGLRRRKVAAV